MEMNGGRRGIAFTLDALIALVIIIALIPLFALFNARGPSEDVATQYLHLQAEDAVDVLSKVQVSFVRDEPVIDDLFSKGVLTDEDLNESLLDVLGGLWATQDSDNLRYAANITNMLIGPLMPKSLEWGLTIENDLIFNSSVMNQTRIVSASRKAASGYARNQSSTGYVARAFLENIVGKEDSSYFFFGGFVGEGNLTATISDIPGNTTISRIYLEVNSESNFSMIINGNYCAHLNVSGGNFTVHNWTFAAGDPCISYFTPGITNNFSFTFDHLNITKHFFGGGYLRVTYTTNQLIPSSSGVMRYHFPGIDGLLNLYDSFYVPGNITSMNAFIRHYSFHNYTTLGFIGNVTFLNHTGTNLTEDIVINNTDFEALFAAEGITYVQISNTTNPLRMITGANLTSGKLNGSVDIVLITDVSGSMEWEMDRDNANGDTVSNCDDPSWETNPDTRRIDVAKCLDKIFINAILGGNMSACGGGTPLYGNRVALINFSTSVTHNTSLQNGGTANLTYLTRMINGYRPTDSTCVSCAINRAYEILATQSTPERQKYVVVMTDGQSNMRSSGTTDNLNGISSGTDPVYRSITAGDGGRASMRTDKFWDFQGTISAGGSDINAISMLNSTFAFAVGNSGEIYSWDGDAWSLGQDIGNTNLYAVDIWNGTHAFTVGGNGETYRWTGSTWIAVATGQTYVWYSVTFANGSYVFAGTTAGRIWAWDGTAWASYADIGGQTIYSLDAFNSTLALAGTTEEEIYRYTGAAWIEDYDNANGNDIMGISFLNGSLAFAVTTNGRVERWVPYTGSVVYTQPGNRRLNSVFMLNASEAYAVGDYGRIINWDGNYWNVTAMLAHAFEGNLTTGTDGEDADFACGTNMNQSYSAMNVNYSTGRIKDNIANTTVDTIGFGPIAACRQANQTLFAAAESGNGTFYASTNASELKKVYCQIAQNINTRRTATQEVTFSGNLTRATLFPESYIEFNYFPMTPDPSYKEIAVTTETDTFPECTGTFFIPQVTRIIDAKLTSYSGNYWTSGAYVNSTETGGGFTSVFNLSRYLVQYADLGDPFHVYLPVQLLRVNETNQVRDELGLNSTFKATNCSRYNRVIYTARLRASTAYGSIFPSVGGRNVTVYYDSNADGIADGFTYVAFGTDLPGFDPAPIDVGSLDPANDAMDNAIVGLLTQLNYIIVPGNSGDAGESTNPIDIIIAGEVGVATDTLSMVPIPWGPTEIAISVWV